MWHTFVYINSILIENLNSTYNLKLLKFFFPRNLNSLQLHRLFKIIKIWWVEAVVKMNLITTWLIPGTLFSSGFFMFSLRWPGMLTKSFTSQLSRVLTLFCEVLREDFNSSKTLLTFITHPSSYNLLYLFSLALYLHSVCVAVFSPHSFPFSFFIYLFNFTC